MAILKGLKHKSCLSLGTCHKYVTGFSEPTPTIYWYAQRNKLTFLNMPVLNTIQEILVSETQCIIYNCTIYRPVEESLKNS